MRRALWVLVPLAVAAGLFVWLRGGVTSSITDDSVATPAEAKSPYGNRIDPRGTHALGVGVRLAFVRTELGARDAAGTFTPRPGSEHIANTFTGVGGVLCWSAPQYMGLPRGTYVVKATLFEGGGADGEPRALAVCYSAPLTLP